MTVFVTLRTLHIVCAALWLGSATLLGLFVLPAVDRLGSDAGRVMTSLQRTGLNAFMASISGLTVLSGLYLYWRATADPTFSGSTTGIVLGIGGLLGLASAIVGGSLVGRAARNLAAAGESLSTTTDAASRTALLADMTRLHTQLKTFGHVVTGMLFITAILMAIAHYV